MMARYGGPSCMTFVRFWRRGCQNSRCLSIDEIYRWISVLYGGDECAWERYCSIWRPDIAQGCSRRGAEAEVEGR